MKVIGIIGSPRAKSNSRILTEKSLEAAKELGAETEVFVLNKMNYKGCQACGGCKTKKDQCVLNDDLTSVLEAVREADAIVFASPVYYGEVSGQFKSFFDRTYSYFSSDFSCRLKPGKKVAIILTQGDPDEPHHGAADLR